ncbi:hypothetical protein L6452_17516 [Arctium lappa]|uniref:Uncharacterized protein n=1 Tax=Arctium lappa TaxID=4217 RepID=A0ACB9C3L4_ARCLA|nr:hypothetical protein L6452_17516 [Arctium lappa]
MSLQAQMYKNDLMMSLGSDTRPSVLISENEFEQWQDRFINFIERQPNGDNMMKSLTQGPMEKPMKEIPALGNIQATWAEKSLREYNADELLRYQVDSQAKSNLILALPNSIYNRIDCFKHNPMHMWTQLEKIMLGTSMSTQLRQTRYMNNFEEFKAKDGESLKSVFDRFWVELYEILMTDETMVMEKKAKLDKKNKPKIVDPIALLASQLVEQALTDEAYDGSTEDDGEALEKAMILLSQHYQKKFQRRTGSNNLRFTYVSKKIEPGASSKPYVPKFEPAKVVEPKKDDKKVMNCYNCGKPGHLAKECRVKVVKDSTFYRKKMELAEKRENGTILMAEEEYWLDHSDNKAENEDTAAICFIGDDKSDDEDEDTSTDESEFKFFWTCEKQFSDEENERRITNKRMEVPFVYTSENAKYFPDQSRKSRKSQNVLNVKSSNKSSLPTEFVNIYPNTDKENVSSVSYDTKRYIPPLVLEGKIVDLEDKLEEQSLQSDLENDLFLFIMKTSIEDKISSGFSKDSKENTQVSKNNVHLRNQLVTQTDTLHKQLNAQSSVCATNGMRKPPPDFVIFKNSHSEASSSISNAQADFLDKVSSSDSIMDDSLTLNVQYYKKKRKRRRSKKSRKHDSVLSENSNSSDFSVSDRTVKKSPKQIWRVKQQTTESELLGPSHLWYLDSGCSKHMTGNKSLLSNFKEKCCGRVKFGNCETAPILGYGDLVQGNIIVKRVSYVEGLSHNLFSIGQFCDKELDVSFKSKRVAVKNDSGKDLLVGKRRSNLYTINLSKVKIPSDICLLSKASTQESWIWHRRLAHLNFKYMGRLVKHDSVRGLPVLRFQKDHLCQDCEKGKMKKASHKPKPEPCTSAILDILHVDLCGPMKTKSIGKKRYVLVIVDDYSRYTWVKFFKSKDETPEVLITLIKTIQTNKQNQVKVVRSDNGTEFKNNTLQAFYDSQGIQQQFFAARTPQQNGVVERRNRTLVEAARSMLAYSGFPLSHWAEAVSNACHTQNRSILHRRFNKTPYELMNGIKPNVKYFKSFGFKCYVLNDRDSLNKFSPKADEGVFLGYSSNSTTYRVFLISSRKVIESVNVKFDEAAGLVSSHSGSEPAFTGSSVSEQISSEPILSPINQDSSTPSLIFSDLDYLFENFYDDVPRSNSENVSNVLNQETESTSIPNSAASISEPDVVPVPPVDQTQSETEPIHEEPIQEESVHEQSVQEESFMEEVQNDVIQQTLPESDT